jgi:DNA-binding MarR family transcriptional regulator
VKSTPRPDLDPVIHPINRLRICAALAAAQAVEFAALQDATGLSPSALSKQIRVLVEAGYIEQHRSPLDSRRIWLQLTREGRRTYRAHLRALQEVLDSNSAAPPDPV